MPRILEGNLLADDAKMALVVARFNSFLTEKLLEAAVDTFKRHGGSVENLAVIRVPGSFEIPLTAMKLAQSNQYDAVVCLGCVIRGATGHYEHVASEVAKGISQVSLQTGVPALFGVITADSLEQAIDRAGAKQGNQGANAMISAIEMVNLYKQL